MITSLFQLIDNLGHHIHVIIWLSVDGANSIQIYQTFGQALLIDLNAITIQDEQLIRIEIVSITAIIDQIDGIYIADVVTICLGLSQNKFVELGLQTSSDATAEFINRCYKTEEYTEAVKALKEIGANVITHIIFGLPGETKDMMMDTVRTSVDAGSDGYKFTCLYVLENTYLEKLWRENQVEILEMEEYFDIVEEAVRLLPEDSVVHRFTGDGPKKILLAPEWTKNKRQVVNYINRRFGL